jgi:hypothetical protein
LDGRWGGDALRVHFNHVAIAAEDRHRSAAFLAELLGLAEPTSWGPFTSDHFELITQPYGSPA